MSSKIISTLTTPTKQGLLTQQGNISPKKNVSKTYNNASLSNSSYRNKADVNQSAQSSLIAKMIENQITTQQKYQNVLIQNKQMEIKLLELQEEAQRLRKDFKKSHKPIQQIKTKIQNGRLSLIEKQKYLEKFYTHLDSKLKPNMHSNLFGRLQKIELALQKKYEQQKHQLYMSLALQHQKTQTSNEELQRLRQYRDQLIKSYTERAIQISSHRAYSQNNPLSGRDPSQKRSNYKKSQKQAFEKRKQNQTNSKSSTKSKQIKINKKQQKKRVKKENYKQCQYLRENIQKLKIQKEIVEKDEKLLKTLLNIDEQHKKYSGYILNGYKKLFTIKYRGILSKSKRNSVSTIKNELKASSVSVANIQKLQKQLKQKVTQRKILQKEVEQRIIGLQECKSKLNQQIGEYSLLQQQIMRISNKNSTFSSKGVKNETEPFNSRLTYNGNLSLQNNRSTYTSYQKHSERHEQDL